ncbi:MAG: type IV secretory system conjugative DNA transfer family protein [Solitalea-like symbiont of Acarus siro]
MKNLNRQSEVNTWLAALCLIVFSSLCALEIYTVARIYLINQGYNLNVFELILRFLYDRNIIELSTLKGRFAVTGISFIIIIGLGLIIGENKTHKYKINHKKLKHILLIACVASVLFFIKIFFEYESDYKASLALGLLNTVCSLTLIISFSILAVELSFKKIEDRSNIENESFHQEKKLINTPDSVNLPLEYQFGGTKHGYINMLNPYAGTTILGLPGSGKSYTWIETVIQQQIEKGFAACIYDFKYPGLTEYAYGVYQTLSKENRPKFCIINFEEPDKSHRCNPIIGIETQEDAISLAISFLVNLNKKSNSLSDDFFLENAINLFAAILWFLKKYKNGQYLSIPHALELAIYPDDYGLIKFLMSEPDVENMVMAFHQGMARGADEMVSGMLASLQVKLARLASPNIYWILSGNDFSLDLNNPADPKILCLANSPLKADFHSAPLSLFFTRMFPLVNKPNQKPLSIVIDELPTVYIAKLPELLSTARSSKIATTIAFQAASMLTNSYGKKAADVVFEVASRNLICGAASIDTAKRIYSVFGKIKQIQYSESHQNRSESIRMADRLPPDKIVNQKQGHFCGVLAQEDGYNINNIFSGKVIVDNKHKPMQVPIINPDATKERIDANFLKIKKEMREEVKEFLAKPDNTKSIKKNQIDDSQPNEAVAEMPDIAEAINNTMNAPADGEDEFVGQFEEDITRLHDAITEMNKKEKDLNNAKDEEGQD